MEKQQKRKEKWSTPLVHKLKFSQTHGSSEGAAEGTELFSSPIS